MLSFTKNATHLVVTGKTFLIKEELKILGGRWDPAGSAWILPVHLDSEYLRTELNNKLKDTATAERGQSMMTIAAIKAYAQSPQGKAEAKLAAEARVLWALDQKKKTGAYHWICCEKCEVINWTRKHTSCQACAEWSGQSWNTFCVNGRRYTGD